MRMEGRRDAGRDSDGKTSGKAFFPFALQFDCMCGGVPIKDALRRAKNRRVLDRAVTAPKTLRPRKRRGRKQNRTADFP